MKIDESIHAQASSKNGSISSIMLSLSFLTSFQAAFNVHVTRGLEAAARCTLPSNMQH